MKAVIEVDASRGKDWEEKIHQGMSLARQKDIHFFDAMSLTSRYVVGDALSMADTVSLGYKTMFPRQEKSLVAFIDQALMELRRDEIDILWLSGSPLWQRRLMDAIKLQKAGKLRQIGLVNMRLKDCKQAQSILQETGTQLYGVRCVYNLLERRNQDILDWCGENDLAFWATDLLASGFLAEQDWWLENMFPDHMARLEPLRDLLGAIGGKYRMTMVTCAMAYVMAKKATPVVHLRDFMNMKQIEDICCLKQEDVLALENKADLGKGSWAYAMARRFGR